MEVWKKGRTNQKTRYRERNPKRTPVRGATGEQVALRENGRKPSNPLLVKNLTSILRTAVEKLLAAKSHFSLLQVTVAILNHLYVVDIVLKVVNQTKYMLYMLSNRCDVSFIHIKKLMQNIILRNR